LEGGALFISRNNSVFSWMESVFNDCGFYDVTQISLEKKALALKLNIIKPKYIFIHSEFYSCVTPYMIGCLLLKLPELNIIVVNFGYSHNDDSEHFIFHGAVSYLDINYGVEEFKKGLKKIRKGDDYYSPGVERKISDLDDKPEYKKGITKRQWQVLLLICKGYNKKKIIANLNIKKRTVDTHIYNLKKLFYASNMVDLSNKAVCMGWVRKEDLGFKNTRLTTPEFFTKKKRRKKIPVNGGDLALIKCLQSTLAEFFAFTAGLEIMYSCQILDTSSSVYHAKPL
jgi:DNA-binding CsgD family transcriptional regulator